MARNFFFIILFLSCLLAQAQDLWKKIDLDSSFPTKKSSQIVASQEQLVFELNIELLKDKLAKTTGITSKSKPTEITIPNTAGILEKFTVWESSNFDPELQAKYPQIRAYQGKGITDPKASINFSFSPKGFQSMVFRDNWGTEFIESYLRNPALYVVFSSKSRNKGSLPINCSTKDQILNNQLFKKTSKSVSNNKVFRTLRLALSCTGEYGLLQGNSVAGALASMNATMTRVNGIFNRDLSVQLVIIPSNELLIFTDPDTDPYSYAGVGVTGIWHDELQAVLNTSIDSSTYDIGHLFGDSGGGGDAGCIGCVCESNKGSGYSSPMNGLPEGDAFDIDFVAHEMGHQLGANHTFSYTIEDTGVNIEPGSGSTIMGYAGVTGDYDMQQSSDDYFAYASIQQIDSNLATKTCIQTNLVANNPPIVHAGPDYSIPKGTAFVLKGSGSDIDNDHLTFTWEQNDSAITSVEEKSLAVPTKTDGPLFRSIYPTDSPIRYMPQYSSVLVNKLTSNWESVSNVERTLHFVLTARDNATMGTAQTASDETIINVKGDTGPFEITTQNIENDSWKQGFEQIIKWNVNKSNKLEGASHVNIKLSIDGGLSFSIVLASNVPNDGQAKITAPNIIAKVCRLLIEPTNNIFYAINSQPFSIGYTVEKTSNTFAFPTPLAIPEQDSYSSLFINYPETSATISDIKVNVNVTHSLFSDLQMDIQNPHGNTVRLFKPSCNNNGTLNLVFDDYGAETKCGNQNLQTIAPYESLSVFYDKNPTGIWVFRIRDNSLGNLGTLNAASLSIITKKYSVMKPEFRILNLKTFSKNNDGTFTVNFEGDDTAPVLILIYNLLGQKVFEKEYPKTFFFDEEIQIPNPKSGMYLLDVVVLNKKASAKILVK